MRPRRPQPAKKIDDIRAKLKSGQDFESLARTYSEDPSGPKGGDLGYIRTGQVLKPFEDALFALKPGEISDVVETNVGFHLIKASDRKPETTIPFEKVKDQLRTALKQEKGQQEANAYAAKVREEGQSRDIPACGGVGEEEDFLPFREGISANLITRWVLLFVIPAQAGIQEERTQAIDKQPAVYILASKRNGTLYIGVAQILSKGFGNIGITRERGLPNVMACTNWCWYELHQTMESAIHREKQLKEWKRVWKLELIEANNPKWRDLYPAIV